ncbi:M23 family peptidase [filamentous cyanobacterium CCP5]|nr:M23 family peptidase [filamentous cyanobacterium CCP5]
MIENRQALMAWNIWRTTGYSALAFGIQVLVASGSLALIGDSARAQDSSPQSDAIVHTSAKYLLMPQSATSRPVTPTATTRPEASGTLPEFSGSQIGATTDPSPSSRHLSMQASVPTPPPIVAQAAAPVPFLEGAATEGAANPGNGLSIEPSTPSTAAGSGTAVPNYDSVFIDPTDYSLGATENPDLPSLVFSERTSGCEVTVAGTQMNQSCGAPQVANSPEENRGIQVGPVNVSRQGLSVGNVTVVSREFLNEKLRPLNILRRGSEEYVFPLSIPAPITSLFGWRVHPIYGDHRFHSGTDLSAPMGTPVLATRAGRVAIADNLGGYGLTVILRHGDGDLESRYAHLSRIAVRPGEWIEQGEVIGLVGSTGNSTGPHLHFEVRQLTAQGWVAADAREILQDGLASLIGVLNNPLQAMAQAGDSENQEVIPTDYPYRPAQPNAS